MMYDIRDERRGVKITKSYYNRSDNRIITAGTGRKVWAARQKAAPQFRRFGKATGEQGALTITEVLKQTGLKEATFYRRLRE
jgi:hypothetical protein